MPACALSCALTWALAWASTANAQNPIPTAPDVEEQVHEIELEIDRDGATLRVTRSFFNPTLAHARIDLPIELPCDATLAQLEIQELGPSGFPRWRAAELLAPQDAKSRFNSYYAGPTDPATKIAGNSDTAVLMTRESSYRCDAELMLYPIPPVQTRTVAYTLSFPSRYDEGRYTIELPSLDGYGRTPTLVVDHFADSSLLASIDDLDLDPSGTTLDGARSHTIVLTPHDAGRGRARAADLDIEALVAATPSALAKLGPDQAPLPHLLTTEFQAPAELARLPQVRRAVLVLDASRSLTDYQREQLQRLGAAYMEAIAKHDAQVEIVLFDRSIRRVYFDFVPAAWGAEDLPKLDIEDGNGSEIGRAVAYARTLLAEPSVVDGADWILVLSDLDLRSNFDLDAERDAAAASSARVHVIRQVDAEFGFSPAAAKDPWTAIARAAGGMAWEADDGATAFAEEFVSPQRIWNLELELEFADASHQSETLERWLDAGTVREWSDHEHRGAALTQAGFVGEVWGQRRAWIASPSDRDARRTAAALATHNRGDSLSDAVLTAFAHYAEVISPFTSAWALASFEGTAPAPYIAPSISCYGHSGSSMHSSRCGGVSRCGGGVGSINVGFGELAALALDHCNIKTDGRYSFETTGDEIVAVNSSKRCVTAQTWATDIRPASTQGHKRVTIEYVGGKVTKVIEDSI